MGQHLTIAGESEVGSPWTPATLRCDSYCFVRARAFFDSVAAFGSDGRVHGMLAESIVPNTDFTEWTITVRPGISFTDGTPVDADAVITNLQATGVNGLLATALDDVAKVPDPARPGQVMLDIDKVDDMTLTIHTGAGGDPARPLPWRDFPQLLAGQWGLIASPRWLDAVADDPALATAPIGSGPFIVDSYEPYGSLEAHRNPNYWMTDADGHQLPYLDSISFRVIDDPETSVEALAAGDIDLFATTNGLAITAAQGRDDVSVTVQDTFVDTYYLLIDLSKPGPLQDRRVRCAMSLAIDRDEFNDATSNGFDPSANGLFSPGQQGYLADNGLPMDQDLETARALIADYESATGTDVRFTLGHTRPDRHRLRCPAPGRLVVEHRYRRRRPDHPPERPHQPRPRRRPGLRGVPLARTRRRARRPTAHVVALVERRPRRHAVAQPRPTPRPRHRRRPRPRPHRHHRRRGLDGRRRHQSDHRPPVLRHPAGLGAMGRHQRHRTSPGSANWCCPTAPQCSAPSASTASTCCRPCAGRTTDRPSDEDWCRTP